MSAVELVLLVLAAVAGVHVLFFWATTDVAIKEQKPRPNGVRNFRIRNDGNATARGVEVFAFGCKARVFTESRKWWARLEDGDRCHVQITCDGDEDEAWFVVMWRISPAFLGRRRAEWRALRPGGELDKHRTAQLKVRRWRRFLALQLDRRIGPSHSVSGAVHRKRWWPVRPAEGAVGPRLTRRQRVAARLRGPRPPRWATEGPKRDYSRPT